MSKGKVAAMQAAVLGAPQGAFAGPLFDTSGALAREIVARPLDYRACQRLEALGVPGRFVAELNARCLIGAARVHLSPDGERWEPEGPDARLLLAVTEGGELADIAAVSTTAPDQIALRTGAGALLGDDELERIERAALAGRRVRLRLLADPLAWLRVHGEGICVLDWAAALPRLRCLGEAVTIEAPPELAVVVRERLARGGLPLVASPIPEGSRLSLAERIGRAA